MKEFSERFIRFFRSFLPAPFTIAVLLTAIAFLVSFFVAPSDLSSGDRAANLITSWEEGMWKPGLLVFAFQMMLMLVLGHVLALSKPASALINAISKPISSSTSKAAFFVCLLTMLMGFFNWGFGLIFGAILARKVGESASQNGRKINYALVGAAGYTGLLVWHGGLSGSSLIKVAETGHLQSLMTGLLTQAEMNLLPSAIGIGETVFSPMNIMASLLLLALVPAGLYLIGKHAKPSAKLPEIHFIDSDSEDQITGAERLDYMKLPAILFGGIVLLIAASKAWTHPNPSTLQWINPNWINIMLFGLAMLMHGTIKRFLRAVEQAISGASGILIQFPLYFGIMGLITGSGLIDLVSETMVSISSSTSYPIFTFLSAGLVNVFVPSGGGQWAVQGAIIVKASMELNVPLAKSILAMAYGDQLTNMLQPFWALPLLGITGLKAKEILPYTLFMMLIAASIFVAVLLLF
ncbi:MAG: TIGR00366 family protein [Flavobacteriales bacterium]|nr:TIGR00366 family protein [Flavobacteriales bacterium]